LEYRFRLSNSKISLVWIAFRFWFVLYNGRKEAIFGKINNGQTFNTFYLGGKIKFKEGVFNELAVKYSRFWDGYSSAENRFTAKPSFQFDVDEKQLN